MFCVSVSERYKVYKVNKFYLTLSDLLCSSCFILSISFCLQLSYRRSSASGCDGTHHHSTDKMLIEASLVLFLVSGLLTFQLTGIENYLDTNWTKLPSPVTKKQISSWHRGGPSHHMHPVTGGEHRFTSATVLPVF